jgi:hypothetical protein
MLTLAVGRPNASLLCDTSCEQTAAAASGCHHQDPATSPTVAGDDCCDIVVPGVTAFLFDDVRRGVSFSDGDHANAVVRYQLARSATNARPSQEPGREWSLDKRPLPTALRV